MITKFKIQNSKFKINWIIIAIIVLASFLRFHQLTNVPPSPSLDEVSIGYNAYSILRTGEDEYGSKFPLLLRAYDDWRPSLYVYLVIPFVQLLGLNILSVRFPSVILSVASVVSAYFLVCELIRISKMRINANTVGLITSFLLAISPWHIYISRLGHEANIGLAFFIFALTFFVKKRLYLSLLFFTLSFVSYQAEKIFIPLFVAGIFIVFWKEMLAFKKKIIISVLILSAILVPFMRETFSPNALIRFQATSVFNTQQERFEKHVKLLANSIDSGDLLGKVVHNRRTVAIQIFTENYISHFNPVWLFSNPSEDKHKVPGIGLLYFWEAPLILLGLITLILYKFDKKIKAIVILWILLSPLPGALTSDAPHAMRSYTFLPSWQILSSLGLIYILNFLKKGLPQKLLFTIIISVISVSLLYLYQQYFIVFPRNQSSSFQYALSNATSFVLKNEKAYDKIVFSNTENLYQSYMFFLFFSNYDPVLYQKQGGTKSGGFAETHKFGKYEFRPIERNEEMKKGNTLYVGNINDFPENAPGQINFKYINGMDAVKIVN